MRKKFYILLISIIPWTAYSQEKISKQEIYSDWIKTKEINSKTSDYRIHLDSLVVKFIDNLRTEGIDTIGVYEEDYVGSYSSDSCMCGTIPWKAFVHWKKNGKTFHEKITNCCRFKPVSIENSTLINYYITSKINIDKGIIMPVILGASKNEKGEIQYTMQTIDHTTHQKIYCDLNGKSKFISFQLFDLENKDNIFYIENMNSVITNWKEIIIAQLKEIEY